MTDDVQSHRLKKFRILLPDAKSKGTHKGCPYNLKVSRFRELHVSVGLILKMSKDFV